MMSRHIYLLAAVALTSASHASFTLATFADPARNGEIVFDWDMTANTLTGSWTNPGLTLLTPGFNGGGQVNDAKFTTSKIQLTQVIANVLYDMGPGSIVFTDSVNNTVMTVNFAGGQFQNPLNAGSATNQGDAVDFSGPNVPTGLTNQAFAFSLANPNVSGSHMTFSSAFTSSADLVPEPSSLVFLSVGALALLRRRRA